MELFNVMEALVCGAGVSGAEKDFDPAFELLSEYTAPKRSPLGSVYGSVGQGEKHILLDAHLDRIGLIVTSVEKSGFLRIDKCGGCDVRVLPAAEVTVYGKKPVYGVITSVPPHLAKSDSANKAPDFDSIFIDTGLPYDELREIVSVGDRATVDAPLIRLEDDIITGSALDDRLGIAVILRVLDILKNKKLNARVTALFSVQEETTEAGGKTGAFGVSPDEAIAVDVSFASAPDIKPQQCGKLGQGGMICISPVLSSEMSQKLISLSEENGLTYQIEVCPETTGTNADVIAVSKSGVKTGLVSVPIRNMHTQAELACLRDAESTAQIIASYILSIGGNGHD
ncbi:MAG: M42 family peptidase [Clostridiales bacterium]|nr:M42 family peptidase [Clostridiales bacterium]MCD7827089.1 M42 family peptidase [Clostridiales bacterium]